jgi:hypothetical protein
VPQFTAVGDHIVIFPGATIPFVLREAGPSRYTLVGECYVHDVMDGEFMKSAAGLLVMIDIA